MMSAEGFVNYAARRYNKEFGKFKVIFDFTLVTVAIILSLIFTQRIEGVREGSLIAACITGYIVSFLNNKIMTRKMTFQSFFHTKIVFFLFLCFIRKEDPFLSE